jgi:hypothetical protein
MIKNTIIGLVILTGLMIIQTSCSSKQRTDSQEQIIKYYYNGLSTGNFKLISKCISDSILIIEKGYILTNNRNDYYQHIQWDSVFKPKYNLIDLKKDSDFYVAIVSKICKRIEFLQDTVITFKEKIEFKNNQIDKMQLLDYLLLDFEKWQQRTESLIAWIDKNHPEISGFNTDMTLKGAQNYLKAVDLYKNKK